MLEEISRRSALSLLLAAALPKTLWPGSVSAPVAGGLRNLVEAHPIHSAVRHQKIYRVDATILLLGVTTFRKNFVGTGCVSLESGRHGDQSLVALQFAAGSDPTRARGLSRFGVIREAAVLDGSNLTRSACAGFMTSSPEKTFNAAQDSLHASSETPCSMVVSDSTHQRTLSWKARFALRGVTEWHQSSDILARAEQSHLPSQTAATHPHGPLPTFLYAVRFATQQAAAATRTGFFYNGEPHTLETQREGDRLQGTIFGEHGQKKSNFSLWLDPNDTSGLPYRIDFRARSFLRLTLEALPSRETTTNQPAQPAPSLAWLLREDTV